MNESIGQTTEQDLLSKVQDLLVEGLQVSHLAMTEMDHEHAQRHKAGMAHLILEIESPLFAGKSLVEQHRMVYDCLRQEMQEDIHSLVLKTRAPQN